MFALSNLSRHRLQLEGASREAEGYLELGMSAQALGSLQRRGKLVHADAHACYLMGEAFRELDRHSEAVIPLRRSVELDPTPTEAWLALGWCYKRSGRLDEAIWSLEQAIRRTPGDALLNYNLACYYSLAGRNLDALRRLKRAFDLDASFRSMVTGEPDFAPLRDDPAFRMLLAATAS
ncbi:TPR repeat-containing protein YrrB [Botrimarina colliarenosi]|uniref:TPR repeat-containing protein YrrB n=1 Tax=Botrimarina colliarenosi TaxID=2528001 RepID=A0A5C6AC65_9BACT|nr:tetratricopeptide repeat protein [Botrimarina colliarenosi]TWT96725.1 TPR repeat-containing protein YrrB [Botrimarina colliarenosi]